MSTQVRWPIEINSELNETGALFRGTKQPVCEVIHSSPSNAEFQNEWSYTPLPFPYMTSWSGKGLYLLVYTDIKLALFLLKERTQVECFKNKGMRTVFSFKSGDITG